MSHARTTLWQVAMAAVSCCAAGWAPAADGDIFWHLAAGREMVQRGALLTHDPFSISAAGRPWVDVHWLFQLGAYGVHSLAGLQGLVIAKCLILGAAALCLLLSLPRAARPGFLLLLAAALLGARSLLLLRPVIVSLLCLSVCFLVLERYRNGASARVLWLLPPLQVLWCNVQGLFALGPALVSVYALTGERARRPALFAALGGSVLASLVSPFGLETLRLPARLLQRLLPLAGSPYQSVAENVPPLSLPDADAGLPWFLAALALLLAVRARRVPPPHLLLLAGFVGLALLGNRNVLLLYFVAAPICALQLQAAKLQLAALPLLALLLIAAAREPAIAEPTPFHFPTGSARAIAAHGGQGKLFSADHHAGYLIWQLYPAFRPFVDTRWILRTPDELHEYLGLADHPERFQGFAARHDFAYVVLPVGYPDRYLGLIAALYASTRWQLVYTDGAEVLFARTDLVRGGAWDLYSASVTDRVLADLQARYAAAPRVYAAARLQLATLQISVGAFAEAQRSLAPLATPEALALRARAHLLAGELDPARSLAERMLRDQPHDVRSLGLMAQVFVQRGQPAQALPLLQRAIELDPDDPEATQLLTNLEARQNH
jgi:tetratricopeptide (TPR) repeat protein